MLAHSPIILHGKQSLCNMYFICQVHHSFLELRTLGSSSVNHFFRLYLTLFVYLCAWTCVPCITAHVEIRGRFAGVCSLHHVSHGVTCITAWILRFSSRHLYLLHHLTQHVPLGSPPSPQKDS